MRAYVVRQYRPVSHTHTEWWWFFTIPFVFSVWYKPGGRYPKTMEQYLEEQTAKVRAYLDNLTPEARQAICGLVIGDPGRSQ
jgi:hypothetical protein